MYMLLNQRKVIRLLSCIIFLFVLFDVSAKGWGDKNDLTTIAKIKKDIDTLSHEIMEGRLTGSPGADAAAAYIESRFTQIGLQPYKGKYKWEFTSVGGKRLTKNAYCKVFEKNLMLGTDILFLPYGEGPTLNGLAYPDVFEPGNTWLVSLKNMKGFENINPQKSMYEFAKYAMAHEAAGVIFLNDIDASIDLNPQNLAKFESLPIAVAFMYHKAYNYFIKSNLKKDWIDIDAKLGYEDAKSTGKNVTAFIDNRAAQTIVITAHYDNMGNMGALYPGANQNASGIAGLLYLAELLKNSKLSTYNYLFIAWSGTIQNFQGSRAFIKQHDLLMGSVNGLIELDCIGTMHPKRKDMYCNGVMTSPQWYQTLLENNTTNFRLQIDSSGYGYGDYAIFYQKDIPVLRLSSGYNKNYLTPDDLPNTVSHNSIAEISQYVFRIITQISSFEKLSFTKTQDIVPELQKLKVDLGIIPDFTFNENGIRIDASIPHRIAARAGLQSGDVILKIGEFIIVDFIDYIEAIKKSNKDKEITIVASRDGIEYKYFVTLKED